MTTCAKCDSEVAPRSRFCSACGAPVADTAVADAAVATAPVTATLTAAGGEGAVRRTVITDGAASTGSAPLIAVGNDSVVKAQVDASVHHTYDHRQTVHGDFVAQQTVIHESAVGSLVRLLTSSWGSAAAGEVERQIAALPADASPLYAVLTQTLRHLVRELRGQFRDRKATGLSAMLSQYGVGLTDVRGRFGQAFSRLVAPFQSQTASVRKRLELCETILHRLHDIAYGRNDRAMIARADQLDELLHAVKSLGATIHRLDRVKMWPMLGLYGVPVFFLLFVMSIFSGAADGAGTFFCLFLVYTALAVGGYYYVRNVVAGVEAGLAKADADVNAMAALS